MTKDRSEIDRIRDQLRRVISGDAWHGPAVLESLDGMTARQAWRAPALAAHSAVEIALHVGAWLEIVRRRFEGTAVAPDEAMDWPAPPAEGEAALTAVLASLRESARALDAALATATDDALGERVPGQRITKYRMLHGVVQHAAYHAGQIMLLRRMLDG